MEIRTRVIKGQYHDSVSLMLAAREMKKIAGVEDAAVVMGTDTNKDLLKQAGLLTDEAQKASADDLVFCVKKDKDADTVLARVEDFLVQKLPDETRSGENPVTSIRAMTKRNKNLNFIEISVAGMYAAKEAREALNSGMHVLLFSDNVSLADEIDLKRYATSKGLLLMGPGAGTAFINGIGMGFANALPRGPVGIISAAGTGLQEVSTILAANNVGVSQAIGTGGRDLSKAVGGIMASAGIEALIADKDTKLIVLISKPSDAGVTKKLMKMLKNGRKPAVVCTLGAILEKKQDTNIHFTRTLEACAMTAARLIKESNDDYADYLEKGLQALKKQAKKIKSELKKKQRFIRGLYSGGTLCYEAQVVWREMLQDVVYSNAPLEKKNYLKPDMDQKRHTTLDLGEEEFTIGRPHPMIDNDLRCRYIDLAGNDPSTAVIVLDVVIGYGAHPDPAEELGAAIRSAIQNAREKDRVLSIIACVTGTKDDPQGLKETRKKLKNAGALVCETNAQAARLAGLIISEIRAVK